RPGRRCTSPGTTRDHRPDLDGVVVGQHRVARHERVAADDEHRLAVEVELAEELGHRHRTGDLELTAGVAEDNAHGGPILAWSTPTSTPGQDRIRRRRERTCRPSRVSVRWLMRMASPGRSSPR